jgi:hypothetical protein
MVSRPAVDPPAVPDLRAAVAALAEAPKTRAPAWGLTYRGSDLPAWGYTADAVGLAVNVAAGELRALLIERGREPFAGHAAWPGAIVDENADTSAREAATRALRTEVGRSGVRYLAGLDSYDDMGRDPRQFAGEIDTATGRWRERGTRVVSKAFLALLDESEIALAPESAQEAVRAAWVNVYSLLPWEDLREERGRRLARQLPARLRQWAALGDPAEAAERGQRIRRAWGRSLAAWNEELANERYGVLLEAGLVEEAWRDRWGQLRPDVPRRLLAPGAALAFDHRRMLADGLSRIRSQMRYVPGVLAALAGRDVTLPMLQATVEATAGRKLHASNFRRVVTESHGLLRPAGRHVAGGGSGPRAALYSFPQDVEHARLDTPIRLPWAPIRR